MAEVRTRYVMKVFGSGKRVALLIGLPALLAAGCGPDEPLPETAPRQISESPFHFPEELWDAGVEGETMLRIYVTERGAVDSVLVERSSGYPAFDTAAVSGAHQLRFDPARRGDDSVGVWVLLPVQFDLPTATAAAEATEPETPEPETTP